MWSNQIIIEIAGGLGNQMFQYAFYLKMKQLGYEGSLYFDKEQQLHNGFELNKVFGLDINFISKAEVDKLLDKKQDLFSKVKRKIVGNKPSFYWEHDKGYEFKPGIFKQESSVYLQGCWLSEKYFKDIETEVRRAFTFKLPDKNNLETFNQIITDENPVSIHIRKGDYSKSSIHFNIDYADYLFKAVSFINQHIATPMFYVFSDDMPFAKEALKKFETVFPNVSFIDWNKGNQSYMDMHLMSRCKHNIIANSTFSWWGAWLNTFKDKIIISPKEWFTVNEWNKNSIIPDSWTVI